MRMLVAAIGIMLAASPLAVAQEKRGGVQKKPSVAAQTTAKKAPSEKQQAHQARMKECAGKAEGRKGEERKQFMSACLKG